MRCNCWVSVGFPVPPHGSRFFKVRSVLPGGNKRLRCCVLAFRLIGLGVWHVRVSGFTASVLA